MDNSDTLKILNGIKDATGKIYKFDNITLNDLLTLDETGTSYLEYVCKKKLSLTYKLQAEIMNNKQALYICVKNRYLDWVRDISNEDIFFEKVEEDKTLLDIIFEMFKTNIGYLNFFVNCFKYRYQIVDYLKKYNCCFSAISFPLAENLFTKQAGIFPIDNYINDKNIVASAVNIATTEVILNYCVETSSYDILKYYESISDKEIIDCLVKREKYDLLYKADLVLLFSQYDEKQCYFDLMIKKHKEGKNVNFEKLSYDCDGHSSYLVALELILMAKNDIIGYVPEINSGMLLFKQEDDDKNVLEWLLEMDRNITISTIIERCEDRKNPDFVIVLRNLGIEDTPIDYKKDEFDFSDEYIKNFNSSYDDSCKSDYEDLLIILRNMFYQDGISNKGAVDALITSYRYLTSVNNRVAIIELRYLIGIKKNYPQNFIYTKDINRSYFHPLKGVCLDNYAIGTINHETSHALHYYLADCYIPKNYLEIIDRARNNPHIIDRIKDFSIKYAELKRNLKESVSQSEISDFYDSKYARDSILELAKFLQSSKEAQKVAFKGKYNEQVLDTILAKTYSVDAFIANRKQIEIDEVVDAMLRSEYDAFIAIGDIIDAIFEGKYYNGVLLDENGVNINRSSGHGIRYYSRVDHGFDEMIANYGAIIKSKNNEGMLEYLRSIVGDEVVDMLAECYEKRILGLTEIINDLNIREINGYAK